jgi:DNA-binding NarL/FixJ family response regulator
VPDAADDDDAVAASDPIRVAVVDDHPVFRLGMAGLLESLPGITVVGQAADAAEALALPLASIDVVLMDLHLGADSGIETTRELLRRDPEARVLVVTMREDDDSVVACMRVGARGYLLKGATPGEVERAVRAVANGEVILGPAVAARAVAALTTGRPSQRVPFPELTDREREVLDLVARGHDNLTIARRLVLSPKTVRNVVSTVLTKLAVRDRAAAVVRAREEGLGTD